MPDKRKLVVLGCGFAGYSLLRRLSPKRWDATLITPRNYFLFTPLLASASSGTVEFRSILEPARRRLDWVRLLEAEAESVEWQSKRVMCRSVVDPEAQFSVPYDDLVIAVGARVADFGVEGVHEHAVTFYSLDDARTVRRRVLEQFARAEIPDLSDDEIRKRLTFVVCGGGPTGVEVAAEIDDLIDRELRKTYPSLARRAKVVLVEALDRILTGFDEALAGYAQRQFQREGIEVRTGATVEAIEEGRVRLGDGHDSIEAELVIWAGGNAPTAFVDSLDEPKTERGRLVVDPHLRIPTRENAYAVGDCANIGPDSLPATAQVAQQQGKHLAKVLREKIRGKTAPPFEFRSFGMLAYVGAGKALVDLPGVKWSGRAAWIFWRSVYLTKLVSFSNKVKVLFDWIKATVFGRDVSRFRS